MNSHVIDKIARLSKAFCADLAYVWLITGMSTHVYAQVASRIESFATKLAGQWVVWISFDTFMFLQMRFHAAEEFLAYWAFL